MRVADIKRAVAAEFDLDPAVMDEPDGLGARRREHVRPRQLAMALSLNMTPQGSADIGRRIGGRDHSTVLHARKAVNAFLLSDQEMRQHTRNILRSLRA